MALIRPLIADKVSRAFDGRTVVDQASLTLEPGKITALIGQSGSGKTTLLRILAGMETPDQGEVRTGDEVLSGHSKFVPIEKRRIGLVFQDFALFPHLTVLGNVMFGLQAIAKAERRGVAERWTETLGLSHRLDAYPHHLSGGEQQRTAIARALAPNPVAILLDEPFSGLDPAMRDQVRSAALRAIRDSQIPALLVTHDANEALVHADTIAVIEAGQILQTDAPDTLYRQPQSIQAARALGPLHSFAVETLPAAWRTRLEHRGPQLWYRPEALRIGTGEPFSVVSSRLAGPVTEIELQSDGAEPLFAACQPNQTLRPGEQVKIDLNPDLVFDFSA